MMPSEAITRPLIRPPFRRDSTVSLALLVLVAIGGCSGCGSDAKESTVTITSSKNIWCTLPIVAHKKGFFEQEGLRTSIAYVQAAKFAMDALLAQSTTVATVVE